MRQQWIYQLVPDKVADSRLPRSGYCKEETPQLPLIPVLRSKPINEEGDAPELPARHVKVWHFASNIGLVRIVALRHQEKTHPRAAPERQPSAQSTKVLRKSEQPTILHRLCHYDHCIRLCGSAGFSPRVVQEAKDMFTLLNLVRAGIGVALVPRSARQMRVNGINFGHIRSRQAEWDIRVAWNRLHESALVRNFVNICLEHSV